MVYTPSFTIITKYNITFITRKLIQIVQRILSLSRQTSINLRTELKRQTKAA